MESQVAFVRPLTLGDFEGSWVSVACFVIVSYDWLLNFDREMLYVWRRGISSASTIYLILRYTSLLSFVVTMLNLFPFAGKTSLSCNVVTRLDSSMDAVVIGSSAAFSALRAYALCGSKPISILVLVIAAASSIPSFYGAIIMNAAYHPAPFHTICDFSLTAITQFRISCALASDLLVLLLTWRRVWPVNITPGITFALSSVLFNDGIIYFIALFLANLINLALINNLQVVFLLIGWISTVTVVITCRFILDLHEASAAALAGGGLGVRYGSATRLSTLHSGAVPSLVFLPSPATPNSRRRDSVYNAHIDWAAGRDRDLWEDETDSEYEMSPTSST